MSGIEPLTPWSSIKCSTNWATSPFARPEGYDPSTYGLEPYMFPITPETQIKCTGRHFVFKFPLLIFFNLLKSSFKHFVGMVWIEHTQLKNKGFTDLPDSPASAHPQLTFIKFAAWGNYDIPASILTGSCSASELPSHLLNFTNTSKNFFFLSMWEGSNLRPTPYQSVYLTNWYTHRFFLLNKKPESFWDSGLL